MAGRINNLEIFAAGSWKPASGGTVTITEQDLDEIVTSFNELAGTNIVKPHLKLGHQEAQQWFGQKTGVPTLGWVEKVWRQGPKLLADIGNVPDALINMIKSKRYHNVSVEVLPHGTVEKDGKKLGMTLSAIALLGTEMPAVKTLAGLANALFAEQPTAYGDGTHVIAFSSPTLENGMFTQEQVDSLVAAAVSKAVGETKGEFAAKITDLSTELGVVKTRAETAETENKSLKGKLAYSSAEAAVDAAIKEGKLLPKQKEFAMSFMTSQTNLKFSDGAEKTPAEAFSEFLKEMKPQVSTKEKGGSDGKETKDYATPAAEVDARVQELRATDAKVTYADALTQVLAADPDLKARYGAAV
jgi:hypothetical protein